MVDASLWQEAQVSVLLTNAIVILGMCMFLIPFASVRGAGTQYCRESYKSSYEANLRVRLC